MARVFTTGLEMGDMLEFTSKTGSVLITSSVKRTGTYALQCGTGGSGYHWIKKVIPAQTEYYFRFAFRNSILDSCRFFQWYSGGTEMGSIRCNSSGRVLVYRGTTFVAQSDINILLVNTWQLIEIRVKIDDASGVYQVRVDGVQRLDFSGDTKPGAQTTIDGATYYCEYTRKRYFDDIAINDTTGGDDTNWPGDGRIIALMPNGAGTYTQLTPSAGANYQCVDERPPNGDSDYVYSSVIDEKDLYALAACGLSDVVISRVYEEIRARETVAEGGEIAMLIRTVATDYQGSDQALTLTYKLFKGVEYLVNPNTSLAWTVVQLDALEAGVVVR